MSQMQLSSLIRERELLEAHAETLTSHLELIKSEQQQHQIKVNTQTHISHYFINVCVCEWEGVVFTPKLVCVCVCILSSFI
jgi:hypothetical protein